MATKHTPFNGGNLKKNMQIALATASAVCAAIPAIGVVIAAVVEAVGQVFPAAVNIIEDAWETRVEVPLVAAVRYMDAKYQDTVEALLDARAAGLLEDAVKDYAVHKLGNLAAITGLDADQSARVENDMLILFQDAGMPYWMALLAMSEYAWACEHPVLSATYLDLTCDQIGIARDHSAPAVATEAWKRMANGTLPPTISADAAKAMGNKAGSQGPSPFTDSLKVKDDSSSMTPLLIGAAALVGVILLTRKKA